MNTLKDTAFKTAFVKDAEVEEARNFFEEKLDMTVKNKSDVKNALALKQTLDNAESVEDLKNTLKYGDVFGITNKTTAKKLNDLF